MKQSTLNNIKQAVNQLIKNNIKLTTEVLSKEAHTSKRSVTEFFKIYPKESFNKYYKNGTVNNSTILKSADENGTVKNSTILKQDTQSGTDTNPVENGTDKNSTDTNMENGTVQSGTDFNPVENGTEEHFNITTEEGYVNQLNRLYSKGSIDKEYYLKQVRVMKNNYPISYELIKEKLLLVNE